MALALISVAASGCHLSHEATEPRAPLDAGVPAVDAFTTSETLYTLTTGDCFTFATREIVHGGGMRCGDFTLEGDSAAWLIGTDGTLCELSGTFATLASVPREVEGGCGRIINLSFGETANLAFLVRLDGHLYRVHVLNAAPPSLVFSFDDVG